MKKRSLILVMISLILIDQITKFIFANKSFFIINYSKNKGVLFGLLIPNQVIIILSIIILLILFFIIFISKDKNKIPLTLLFSGILSNFIDRVSYSYVRDFIDLKFWPIFNLADVFCVIGVILILIPTIKKSKVI